MSKKIPASKIRADEKLFHIPNFRAIAAFFHLERQIQLDTDNFHPEIRLDHCYTSIHHRRVGFFFVGYVAC